MKIRWVVAFRDPSSTLDRYWVTGETITGMLTGTRHSPNFPAKLYTKAEAERIAERVPVVWPESHGYGRWIVKVRARRVP